MSCMNEDPAPAPTRESLLRRYPLLTAIFVGAIGFAVCYLASGNATYLLASKYFYAHRFDAIGHPAAERHAALADVLFRRSIREMLSTKSGDPAQIAAKIDIEIAESPDDARAMFKPRAAAYYALSAQRAEARGDGATAAKYRARAVQYMQDLGWRDTSRKALDDLVDHLQNSQNWNEMAEALVDSAAKKGGVK